MGIKSCLILPGATLENNRHVQGDISLPEEHNWNVAVAEMNSSNEAVKQVASDIKYRSFCVAAGKT